MLRSLLAEFFPKSANKVVRERSKGKFAALESLQKRIRAADKVEKQKPTRRTEGNQET